MDYECSFTHCFGDNSNALNGTLYIEETWIRRKPYLMVNWVLVDDDVEFLIAWQIIIVKEWIKLILGKTPSWNICSNLLYNLNNLKKTWLEEDLSGTYNWKWSNLHWSFVVSLDSYRTRATKILDSTHCGSFRHEASIELRRIIH